MAAPVPQFRMSQSETERSTLPKPARHRKKAWHWGLAIFLVSGATFLTHQSIVALRDRRAVEKRWNATAAEVDKQNAETALHDEALDVWERPLGPLRKEFREHNEAIEAMNRANVTDLVLVFERPKLLAQRALVRTALEKTIAWQKRATSLAGKIPKTRPAPPFSKDDLEKLDAFLARFEGEAARADAQALENQVMYLERLLELLDLMDKEWGKWYVTSGTDVRFTSPLAAQTCDALREEMKVALDRQDRACEEFRRQSKLAAGSAKTGAKH